MVGQPDLALGIGGRDDLFDGCGSGVGREGVEIHRHAHQAGGQRVRGVGFVAHGFSLWWNAGSFRRTPRPG